MTQRLRFLLDTNILIPLQDSMLVLEPRLANFVRLAGVGAHQLLYHPASKTDIDRDKDLQRRTRTLARLQQYTKLEGAPTSPRNTAQTSANDVCDNDILHAIECSAVHALVTEDKEIHTKARQAGFGDRVYNIRTAEDWLRRLHEPAEVHLPNIEDVPMYGLTSQLDSALFDSLRANYDTPERSFNKWFHDKAQTGRKAWIARTEQGSIEAICIYAIQTNEVINDAKESLQGFSLKLCTFKVGEQMRGRKIGELFLKAAFRFATDNRCENIFVHTSEDQSYLLELLSDFGFQRRGMYGDDIMLVKAHPSSPPVEDIPALDYAKLYFPHYRKDASIQKFLIPIQPHFHKILFPDYQQPPSQLQLFDTSNNVGNAIKLAYLCHAQTKSINVGDLVLFYRTDDEKSVTSIGVVDQFEVLDDPAQIASLVSRRTVYTIKQIDEMAKRRTKVILFRLVKHLPKPVSYDRLQCECVVSGPIQSIRKITDESFSRVLAAADK